MTELPDRLLRGVLHDSASAAAFGTCADAETLAAWADGTLTATARAAFEAHGADCARCQALIAAVMRTEPPPIARPWWRAPVAWLVPLAAAAVALVIVGRLAFIEPPSPALVAFPSPAAAALPAPGPAAASPAAGAREQAVAPAGSAAQTAASAAAAPARLAGRSVTDAAGPSAALPATRQKAETIADAAPAAPGQAAPGQAPATAEPAAKDLVAPKEPAPAAPAAAGAAPARSTQVNVAAADRDDMRRAPRARAFAAAPMMNAPAPAPVAILSPDPLSQWRSVDGRIEHTTDGGKTWQAQSIDGLTPVRAGAAPSARVCWLVGAGGLVLVTTDGTAWVRAAVPDAIDLVAVEATDASHATVTTIAGRRFMTSDGGKTWTPR